MFYALSAAALLFVSANPLHPIQEFGNIPPTKRCMQVVMSLERFLSMPKFDAARFDAVAPNFRTHFNDQTMFAVADKLHELRLQQFDTDPEHETYPMWDETSLPKDLELDSPNITHGQVKGILRAYEDYRNLRTKASEVFAAIESKFPDFFHFISEVPRPWARYYYVFKFFHDYMSKLPPSGTRKHSDSNKPMVRIAMDSSLENKSGELNSFNSTWRQFLHNIRTQFGADQYTNVVLPEQIVESRRDQHADLATFENLELSSGPLTDSQKTDYRTLVDRIRANRYDYDQAHLSATRAPTPQFELGDDRMIAQALIRGVDIFFTRDLRSVDSLAQHENLSRRYGKYFTYTLNGKAYEAVKVEIEVNGRTYHMIMLKIR